MAPRLREEDRQEIETASGECAEEVLPRSVLLSRDSYTIRLHRRHRIDRDPAVLFGVMDDHHRPGMGIMWMVATPDVMRAKLSVLREAGYWLDAWCRRYSGGLHNIVDTRNDTHLRWLAYLGFHFAATTHDINGVAFRYAWRPPKETHV